MTYSSTALGNTAAFAASSNIASPFLEIEIAAPNEVIRMSFESVGYAILQPMKHPTNVNESIRTSSSSAKFRPRKAVTRKCGSCCPSTVLNTCHNLFKGPLSSSSAVRDAPAGLSPSASKRYSSAQFLKEISSKMSGETRGKNLVRDVRGSISNLTDLWPASLSFKAAFLKACQLPTFFRTLLRTLSAESVDAGTACRIVLSPRSGLASPVRGSEGAALLSRLEAFPGKSEVEVVLHCRSQYYLLRPTIETNIISYDFSLPA